MQPEGVFFDVNQRIMLRERDVYDYFGHTYASRGDVYARSNRVRDVQLDLEAQRLIAEVQGSERLPYKVQVIFFENGIEDAICSCPIGGRCKHSAALLLYAIRN